MERLGAVVGRLRAFLGPSWGVLGRLYVGRLGALCSRFGPRCSLGACRAPRGVSLAKMAKWLRRGRRSPHFARRAPRCTTRGYLRALARAPPQRRAALRPRPQDGPRSAQESPKRGPRDEFGGFRGATLTSAPLFHTNGSLQNIAVFNDFGSSGHLWEAFGPRGPQDSPMCSQTAYKMEPSGPSGDGGLENIGCKILD